MTVTLDGTGGVLTRIGALYRFVEQIRLTAKGTGAAGRWPYELNDLYVKVEDAANVVQEALDGIPRSLLSAVSSAESLAAACQTAAQTILIEMVDADDPLPQRTVAEALRVLIEQMVDASESVAANTVSASVTPGSGNVSDGVMLASVLDPRGRTLENVLAEDVLCTRDATAQQFVCAGEAAASSKLSADWPLGSGASQSVTVTDANAEVGLVLNGSFNTFTTANTPDDWSIVVGAAGSDILEEATTVLKGAKALEIDGDGATLTQIRQDIAARVLSRTPYAFNLFAKVDVVPAAGVLTVDLFDGSSVIQDDEGTNCSFTVDLTGLTTSWSGHGAIWRIADPLPTNVYLRVRLSTALSSGSSLFIDQLAGIAATRLYAGGPYVAAFAGGTNFAKDDTFSIAVANNRSSVYQEAVDVFFDSRESDRRLPTDGSPTVTNSLPTYEGS